MIVQNILGVGCIFYSLIHIYQVYINTSSPSRDKASRMLRQAVARSEIDCHSSSVESVVSERTVTQRKKFTKHASDYR